MRALMLRELSKMAKLSKKQKLMAERIEPGKSYPIEDAVSIISEFASKNSPNLWMCQSTWELIRVSLTRLCGARQFCQLVLVKLLK